MMDNNYEADKEFIRLITFLIEFDGIDEGMVAEILERVKTGDEYVL